MPRKTRKQKERAAKRMVNHQESVSAVKREFEFKFKSSDSKISDFSDFKKGDKSIYSSSNRFILRDLTKTIILAVGILAFEIMIYWAWFK